MMSLQERREKRQEHMNKIQERKVTKTQAAPGGEKQRGKKRIAEENESKQTKIPKKNDFECAGRFYAK